ncbi:uncharacterized protein METZ01_LOCUS145482 [marine metagenome]|uniref:Uncharacterized protein n=1 Tax=marine metagenome TaxID=408172 RepID=A0A381ZTK8_9ZZZZ
MLFRIFDSYGSIVNSPFLHYLLNIFVIEVRDVTEKSRNRVSVQKILSTYPVRF